ncbi:MAG: DUF5522 domain-containing protein [Bradymonadia bacterium]
MTTRKHDNESSKPIWREIHERACKEKALAYTDPQTGYRVFTAFGLRKRARCCGSGCRHCPFGHVRVKSRHGGTLITEPYLIGDQPDAKPVTLLFWSGGKDAYLALLQYLEQDMKELILVTVYSAETNEVSHQDVHIDLIKAQAAALNLSLLLVPTYVGDGFEDAVQRACAVVERWATIDTVVFGDLNLTSVRQWRETVFANEDWGRRIQTCFPLWHIPYESLIERLTDAQVHCVISAVLHPSLKARLRVGDDFDRTCFESLPGAVDAFGEGGEFHTVITPTSLKPLFRLK